MTPSGSLFIKVFLTFIPINRLDRRSGTILLGVWRINQNKRPVTSFPSVMYLNSFQLFRIGAIGLLLCLCLSGVPVFSSSDHTGPQAFDKLTVGKNTFFKVRVKSVTPNSVTIFHSKGITQVSLSDLSPELQKAYQYDPEKSAVYLNQQHQRSREQTQARAERLRSQRASQSNRANQESSDILQTLSSPLELKPAVDLRPRIRELSLISKNQGLRPSCAIFAVVSALEIQNARHSNKAVRLSEEYLIWATRKSLGLDKMTLKTLETGAAKADAGFALMEVVSALGTFGIPKQKEMPNTFGKGMEAIEPPPEQTIKSARERCKYVAYDVAARDPATSIEHLIKILNAKQPLVIGLGWPTWRKLGGGHFLSKQKPSAGYSHAVTLVGYTCESGRIEDTRFIFKNSYGVTWGLAGYGIATYDYLIKNLHSAIYLDSVSNRM